MYCRNCGKEISDQAIACISCGMSTKVGKKHCPHCGEEIASPDALICTKCGAKLDTQQKDWLVALLLCIFLGGLGIHRFYTGHIVTGIVQLLTLGGCGIWVIIDLIIIATGTFKDTDGNELAR